MPPSYAHGAGAAPLLGETIGDNLDRTIARFGDREALVSVHQDVRYTYARVRRGGRPARRGRLLAAGHRARRSRRHLEPELRRVGARPVRDRQGGHHPRQHQPRLPHVGARVRAAPVGLPGARRRDARSRRSTTSRWSTRSAHDCRRSSRSCSSGRDWEMPRRRCSTAPSRAAPPGRDAVRRPDQHPVHERHDRLPQGRDAQPPQHPQQRLLRRRGLPLHRARPGLHPGAVLPLLRHGPRQPRLHDARRLHGDPGARVRPGGDARGGRGRALHEPLRRADDVHRRARAPATSASSTSRACAPASWPARRARSR